jgi:hypothetical protein
MADQIPLQLLNLATLSTIGGQVVATTAVTNGLSRAFNWQPRWLGLVVALLSCGTTTYLSSPGTGNDWFLAVLNAFVVYFASAGTSAAGAAVTAPPPSHNEMPQGTGHESMGHDTGHDRFLRPWF